MKIQLNERELILGTALATSITIECIRNNSKSMSNMPHTNRWNMNIEGYLAEMAVAKAFNLYWNGGGIHENDVGDFEVRHTQYKTGKLILRDRDVEKKKQDCTFILVTGKEGDYELQGWVIAKDVMKKEYLDKPSPKGKECWCVPQNKLKPMKELFKKHGIK